MTAGPRRVGWLNWKSNTDPLAKPPLRQLIPQRPAMGAVLPYLEFSCSTILLVAGGLRARHRFDRQGKPAPFSTNTQAPCPNSGGKPAMTACRPSLACTPASRRWRAKVANERTAIA
jgi:hypothetical protein